MSAGGPNNCTVELVTGRFIHLEEAQADVQKKIDDARRQAYRPVELKHPTAHGVFRVTKPVPCPPPLVSLKRSRGTAARRGRGFQEIQIDPAAVVAIYPLTMTSEMGDE